MSKSMLARGASMAADVWGKLDTKVQAKGGTTDALHILAKEEGDALLEVIADLLVRAELKTRNRFPVSVDYTGLTKNPDAWLAGQIAAGHYSYVNEHITVANFPISGTGLPAGQAGVVETEIILVSFDRDISSDYAVAELSRMGLEPARLEHATAFGAKYSDVQREYPIAFLGSSWVHSDGRRSVPCLDRWLGRRKLYLRWWPVDWPRRCRFAAVRKPACR